jgi:hypothetical protein
MKVCQIVGRVLDSQALVGEWQKSNGGKTVEDEGIQVLYVKLQ